MTHPLFLIGTVIFGIGAVCGTRTIFKKDFKKPIATLSIVLYIVGLLVIILSETGH